MDEDTPENTTMANDISQLNLEQLRTLAQLTRELASETDSTTLLEKILASCGNFIDSSLGSILLLDPDEASLFFAAAIGENAERVITTWGEESARRIPLEASIAGRVLQSGRPLALNRMDSYFEGVDISLGSSTSSIICVPLSVSGKSIGVMQFINNCSAGFTQGDIFVLTHFASICAALIRNVQYLAEFSSHMGFTSAPQRNIPEIMTALSGPGVRKEMSIVFVDMRGFSRLSVLLDDPREILLRLQEYLDLVSTEVTRSGGTINKILGDGVLALFDRGEFAVQALRCSFAIVEKFTQLSKSWEGAIGNDLSFLDIGIGITTDSVLRGTLKGKFFKDYSVTGTAVNMAATLQQEARDGLQILVDRNTYLATKRIVRKKVGPTIWSYKKSGQILGDSSYFHIQSIK